jgi:hypothetical protein
MWRCRRNCVGQRIRKVENPFIDLRGLGQVVGGPLKCRFGRPSFFGPEFEHIDQCACSDYH